MKKILFTLCLFVIMQKSFAGEHYYYYYENHTLNISGTPFNSNVYANIGDSVSLYIYNTYWPQGPYPCGEWVFAPCSPAWNCYASWDTIPNSFMAAPLNVVITQYGSYATFADYTHQFIIVAPPALPTMPNNIAGRKNAVCNLSNIVYAVVPFGGVSYLWTVPPGTTIVSGQYSNVISVNYPNVEFSGQVTVKGVNIMGSGPARILSVTSNPVAPSNIAGPISVCSGSSGNAYSIPPVFSAVSYKWVGPPGSHISDGTTTSVNNILTTTSTSVTVSYGTVTPTSVLKVKANNNCGFSSFRKLTLIPCGPRNASDHSTLESFHNIDYFNIFPTSVNSSLTIQLNTIEQSEIEISFFDIHGKQLKGDLYKNISGPFIKNENLEALSKGIYFLRVKAGNEVIQRKFIKM